MAQVLHALQPTALRIFARRCIYLSPCLLAHEEAVTYSATFALVYNGVRRIDEFNGERVLDNV